MLSAGVTLKSSLCWFSLVMIGAFGLSSGAYCQTFKSAQVDGAGNLTLTLLSGKSVVPPRLREQVSFSEARLSSDHEIAGWLAAYAGESTAQASSYPLPMTLVLYRAGHVLRTFETDQVFWSWHYANRDRDVAFCTGPTHGGAARCELRKVRSGKFVARWLPTGTGKPPAWAHGLSY